MDEVFYTLIGLAFCCVSSTFWLIGLFTSIRWLSERLSGRQEKMLSTALTIRWLKQIRGSNSPLEALDAEIVSLERTGRFGFSVSKLEVDDIKKSEADEGVQEPSPPVASQLLATDPSTGSGHSASTPVVPPAESKKPASLGNWFALDNITLLLYLGAALVVIAVGVFVGSSWEAISSFMRWVVVALFALAFLLVGEGFVRYSAVLRRAGETFRGVGIVLLPFVVLAYDRFVLDGEGSTLFWLSASAGLAVIYYLFYFATTTSRLTAYLAALSLGLLVILLPDWLGWDTAWRAPALVLLAALMWLPVWQMERDGRRLLPRLRAGSLSALGESHFLLGALYLMSSWLQLVDSTFDLPSVATLYFVLHTLLFVWLTFWIRHALFAGAAAWMSGLALFTAVEWLVDPVPISEWSLLIGWNALALFYFMLAPRLEAQLPRSRELLTAVILWWSGIAFLASLDTSLGAGFAALGSILFMLAFVATAMRFKQSLFLWPALLLLHIAIFAILDTFETDSPTLLIPTVIWLILAAVWLAGMYLRLPTWAARFPTFAFVAEAFWILFFAHWEEQTAALASVLLTLGWIQWARKEEQPLGVAFAITQGIYAEFALTQYLMLPQAVLSFGTLIGGMFLTLLSSSAPAYASRVMNGGGLCILLFAPLMSPVGELFDVGEERGLSLKVSSQLTLGGTALAYALLAFIRDSRYLTLSSILLAYTLIVWLTGDYLPAAAAPLVAFAVAILTLAIAPYMPNKSTPLLDPLAMLTALFAPISVIFAAGAGAPLDPIFELTPIRASQLSLLLGAALFAARGWQQEKRPFILISGMQIYFLYVWIALEQDITTLQAYSVPLAILLFAFSWLYTTQRQAFDIASTLTLLLPATLQLFGEEHLLYSLILGGWGLLLLAIGITLSRRILRLGGVLALLIAALRQIWSIAAQLPPSIIIGLVGLVLMIVAILLTLRRDVLMAWQEQGKRLLGEEEK